jgi:hypothetical protein
MQTYVVGVKSLNRPQEALAAWSSGVISTSHLGDWSYGSNPARVWGGSLKMIL